MKTIQLFDQAKPQISNEEQLFQFYEEATEDYAFWSKDFNMHFGWFDWGKTNPFKRDEMLNLLNDKMIANLGLHNEECTVVDLGCGMGGTMRRLNKIHPNVSITGITLSDFQKVEGNKLLRDIESATIELQNYNSTKFKTNSIDGALAIESFCHSGHSSKTLHETYRILKPNANLVISDAFLKKPKNKISWLGNIVYNKLCEKWSLEGLANIYEYTNQLRNAGFKKVTVKDISWSVAPSVLHVPIAIPAFILKKLLLGEKVKSQSWNNLFGSFYALMSGLLRKEFGYYQIVATK